MNTELLYDVDDPSDVEACPEDGLEAEILAELREARQMVLRSMRRLDARAETDEGQDALPQLNNAMVKAARAHRQIAVLQLEIAGKRPLPGTRTAAVATANDNTGKTPPARSRHWTPKGYPFDHGDYTDYDDYTDDERKRLGMAKFHERLTFVVRAMNEDFKAAGREDVLGQSAVTKAKLILGIPHPATDACLADVDTRYVEAFFGRDNLLPLKLGPGPPGVWEKWDSVRAMRDTGVR